MEGLSLAHVCWCFRELNLAYCEQLTDRSLETLAMYCAGNYDVDPYSSLSDSEDDSDLLAALALSQELGSAQASCSFLLLMLSPAR